MKYKSLSILIIVTLNITMIFAQQKDKINVAFQEVTAINNNSLAATYKTVLYEVTLNNIINLNKFNVINRSPEMWRVIENELALQDFIEPKTAINLGKMIGAQYLIEGNISQFSSERKLKHTNDKTIDYYFSCIINATLKIINLQTGQYEESVRSEITVDYDDREQSIQNAIQKTSTDLTQKLSKSFLLTASIKKTSFPDVITIDKGSLDGVRLYQSFVILEDDKSTDEKKKVGVLKIISTTEYESNGRLLNGAFKTIGTNHTAVESIEESSNVVAIEKKEKDRVYINAGKDLNIKRGDVFVALQKNETNLGQRSVIEEKVVGKIYVKEVNKDFSKAKIISGFKNLVPGTVVTERKETKVRLSYLQLRYKAAIGLSLKPTIDNGKVSVVNGLGTFEVDTKYLSNFKLINNINIVSIGIGTRNLAKDLSTTFYVDLYNMGSLRTWVGNLEVNYEKYIIHDRVSFYMGGAIGYGGLKQDLPDNYVDIISGRYSSQLKSNSIFLAGDTGIKCIINRFIIGAGIAYDYINFSKWQYDIEVDKKTKTETAPDKIIPYANVNLSGLYYNGTIAYIFKK